MPEFIKEINCSSAGEFLANLSPLTSTHNFKGYIFRGHSDDSYELIPTSIRNVGKDDFWRSSGMGKPIADQSEWEIFHSRAEYNILREFYKIADRRGLYVPHAERVRSRLSSSVETLGGFRMTDEEWLPSDLLELAGLAQHYGLPTRLLDWSYDPLIAAYFAAASAKPNKYLSVWALDADAMMYMNETVHRSPLRIVTPPYFGNPNLAAQSGVFTNWSVEMPGLPNSFRKIEFVNNSSLEKLIKLHAEQQSWEFLHSPFLKFKLPSEHANLVLQLLQRSGYGASRLFPDYGGVAKEVIQKHESQE